jgi:hypothetical protein
MPELCTEVSTFHFFVGFRPGADEQNNNDGGSSVVVLVIAPGILIWVDYRFAEWCSHEQLVPSMMGTSCEQLLPITTLADTHAQGSMGERDRCKIAPTGMEEAAITRW